MGRRLPSTALKSPVIMPGNHQAGSPPPHGTSSTSSPSFTARFEPAKIVLVLGVVALLHLGGWAGSREDGGVFFLPLFARQKGGTFFSCLKLLIQLGSPPLLFFFFFSPLSFLLSSLPFTESFFVSSHLHIPPSPPIGTSSSFFHHHNVCSRPHLQGR